MSKLIGMLVVACCVAASCGSSNTATVSELAAAGQAGYGESPTGDWTAGVNAAGWDFHRHLHGNAASSPVGIGVAFSMARAGASAETAVTLDKIFAFPEAGVHNAASGVMRELAAASAESVTLAVANRLFPDDDFVARSEFLDVADTHYGAAVEPVDTADGDAAADTINKWVSDSTRGLIPEIVSPNTVTDQKLLLVNTVYLKADWAKPFPVELTRDDPFTTASSETVMVPFMRDWSPTLRSYVQLETATAVELPYAGDELAMWLIVPHDLDGLAAVEESLSAAALTGLKDAAETGKVDLTMPKWEQTLPAGDLFQWLCPQRFCPGAPFEGIAAGIVASAAVHGVKVIVDEIGTEAAAVTAFGAGTTSVTEPDEALVIVADRPFLWAIIHNGTKVLLFVGRLTDPSP